MRTAAFVLLMCIGFADVARAQNQVNYWMSDSHGLIYFSNGIASSEFRDDGNLIWRTAASISDSMGNLLFYTNGYRIFNKNFQVMQNGNNLNIGDYLSFGYDLLAEVDGACIIPVPGGSDKYYLFHTDMNFNDIPQSPGVLFPNHIYFCLIDMSLSGGNGGVVVGQKDIPILNDTLTQMGMKAVKHGNGRDWWLLCHEYGSNRYYRFLIDPIGIHGPYDQLIGIEYEWYNAMIASPMKFSQDGSKFAQLSSDSNCFELYDFDRCTGLLSNYERVAITLPYDSLRSFGLSFSPSNRFMYISYAFNEILQFDLTAPDIYSTRTVVGIDDGIADPFSANYNYQEIGLDGRIYIVSYDDAYSLHIINNPDSLGIGCDFVQRGFSLDSGTTWFATVPNIPNYSLYALVGSGCDTITSTNHLPSPTFTWNVYPNPFTNELQLNATGITTKAFVEITDVLGRTVYSRTLSASNHFIHQAVDVSMLSPGVYIVTLTANNERFIRKVVRK